MTKNMNKNIVVGVMALGGLILITSLLTNTPKNTGKVNQTQEVATKILPSDVVTRFPMYPGATVLNQQTSTGKDGRISYSFSLETNSSIKVINEWYRKALSSEGWKIKSDKNIGGYQIIQSENGNLYTSMQAANGKTPGTTIINQQAQIRP